MGSVTKIDVEKWKKKYFDHIDELERKEKEWGRVEKALKKTIGTLSKLAEGGNPLIDRNLRQLRDLFRHKVDSLRVNDALDRLCEVIDRAGAEAATLTDEDASTITLLLSSLRLPDSNELQALKDFAGKADDQKILIEEVAGLLNSHLAIKPPVHKQSEGLISKIFGQKKPDSPGESKAGHGDSSIDAHRQCLLAILNLLDVPEDRGSDIAHIRESVIQASRLEELESLSEKLAEIQSLPGRVEDKHPPIQEVLIRLLEQLVLPVELQADVDEIKDRLEKQPEGVAWETLLKDVAALINAVRRNLQQEKHEFEYFLQQITLKLQDLDNIIQLESGNIDLSVTLGRNFDQTISERFDDMRQLTSDSSDLEQLKQQVQGQLNSISTHVQDYRDNEYKRSVQAKDNLSDMKLKVLLLEDETAKLQLVIEEKNRQAMFDALTGMPNRLAYDHRIVVEIARWKRFGHPLSLAIWDVDYFKKVNDTFGHAAGDKVLKTIAEVLSKRIRKTDFIARYGGEEFVMLLPGTIEEETLRLVNELRNAVKTCGFHYKGESVQVTISCGISSFRENDTLESVFTRADDALYKAKKGGRNQCVVAACRSF